jgi:hypothetical protein
MAEEIKEVIKSESKEELSVKDEILKNEDESKIDGKEKLVAFIFKYLLLYWSRVIALIAIIGAIILLFSGYSLAYKGFSCSKTQTEIPKK